jgi:hypothetical protein
LSDIRTHRGPHPEDHRLFGPAMHPRLAAATDDLSWLLSRGYAAPSSLKLVGDRYALEDRQRTAVARCACSDEDLSRRKVHETAASALAGQPLWLDGYNVLTTVEAALSGGVILAARDGTYRDMASMHGSYRKVSETLPALRCIGQTLAELGASPCRWLLDRPVSNSGRLKRIVEDLAAEAGWLWSVELVDDPDKVLGGAEPIVATADSAILDRCRAWFNLARETLVRRVPDARVLRMGPEA